MMTAEQATDPAYWAKHLRQPVQFSAGIQTLLEMEDTVFLEVGPGNALSTVTKQQIKQDGSQLTYTTLRHPRQQEDDRKRPLTTIGQLWLAGVPVQWQKIYKYQNRQHIPLPLYPFERQRYWLDPPTDKQPRHLSAKKKAPLADWFYLPTWQHTLPPTTQQYLQDKAANWLIFIDDAGLGSQLESALCTQSQQVSVVKVAKNFRATRRFYIHHQSC
ncbi:MAG: hypothetical protein M5U34_37720 [Chloroflexi bacterium]|nr:hypothetical protein [Chloroflexota bacterium]